MRYQTLGCLALLLMTLGATASLKAAEAADWQRVQSQSHDFSVLMPGTPKFSTTSTPSPVGRIPESICEVKSDHVDLTAEVSVLPAIAVLFGGHN